MKDLSAVQVFHSLHYLRNILLALGYAETLASVDEFVEALCYS